MNACELLVKKYPKDADLYFNIGNYLGIAKNEKDAARRSWYEQGIQANPNYYRSHIISAILAELDGNNDKAIADLDKAIELNPKDAFAYTNRGRAWNNKGNHDKAIADYNEAIKLDLKHAAAYSGRGIAWNDKGNNDKAIADYNEVIRLEPKGALAYYNRGNAWKDKSDFDKAISDYNEAIRLNPKLAAAYNNRGFSWINKGNSDKAIADYNEAIRLNPKLAAAYNGRGIAWKNKGDDDKAIADLKEAVRLDPNSANAKETLQLTLDKKQKKENRKALVPLDDRQQSAKSKDTSSVSSNGKRVALVIGNSSYKSVVALENPARDAELFAKTLRNIGFDDVSIKLNLSRAEIMAALKSFEKIAVDAEWAAIYFAGHGIEVGGVNYMIPIDAQITEEKSISTQTVNMEYLINSVEVAKKLRLVILDACRNNPYAKAIQVASASRGVGELGSSSIGRGLSRVEPQPGTLVVYSAKAGNVALDGDGKNSPFAEALVKRIEQKPPIEVRRVFDFVREDVYSATKKEQQPFAYGSLKANEDFFFVK